MEHISKLPHVKTTIFTTIGNLAREHNAIDLSQGFPNFESDPNLIKLVSQAMNSGYNKYAPMPGYYVLREAISEKINRTNNYEYHPET
jgi:methionine aminotransferase